MKQIVGCIILCLSSFFVSQIATQVAVLISKVARVGIRDWPELFPALLKVCVHAAENKVMCRLCSTMLAGGSFRSAMES